MKSACGWGEERESFFSDGGGTAEELFEGGMILFGRRRKEKHVSRGEGGAPWEVVNGCSGAFDGRRRTLGRRTREGRDVFLWREER